MEQNQNKFNILFFKFSLGIYGGEKFNLVLAKDLIKRGYSAKIVSNFRPLLSEARKIGISTISFWWGYEASCLLNKLRFFLAAPFNFLKFWLLLRSQRKRTEENVVIFQSLNEKILATKLAKKLGWKVIWVEHVTVSPWLTKTYYFRKAYRKVSAKADRIIAISEVIKKELIDLLQVDPEKIIIVYNGIDTNEFRPAEREKIEQKQKELGIYKDSVIIGTVARLASEKGIDILIRAAKEVIKFIPRAKFLIIGEGPERRKLEKLTRILGCEKNIYFLGYRYDVKDLISVFDVFVLPSVTRESFGIVVIEAMAEEVPVVASRLGGIPEIIEDGKNGFLFSPGDSTELARIITDLARDSQKMKVIGENGRRSVLEKFSLEAMTNNLIKVLNMNGGKK